MGKRFLEEAGACWATFFYVGRSPWAPGTCGSLAALPFAWFLWQLPAAAAWALVAITFLLGVAGAGVIFRRTGESDHQSIVIDEVVGIFVTSAVAQPGNLWHFTFAFLLFRLFDIWKPWPVRWLDRRIKSPLGTMLDDLAAALIAALVLLLAIRLHLAYFLELSRFFLFGAGPG